MELTGANKINSNDKLQNCFTLMNMPLKSYLTSRINFAKKLMKKKQ
jgi:hypothetical protein